MNILYHVSFEPVEKFEPRIPKNRCPGEDATIPRICFSERMELAITSMPQGGEALRGMLKLKGIITPILHCYMCNDWEQPEKLLSPDMLKDRVGDAEGTREWWAIQVPTLKHVMLQIFDAKFKNSIDKFGNTGVVVMSIDRDVIHELPKNAPEISFASLNCSIRSIMAIADEKQGNRRKKNV